MIWESALPAPHAVEALSQVKLSLRSRCKTLMIFISKLVEPLAQKDGGLGQMEPTDLLRINKDIERSGVNSIRAL